MSEAVLPLQWEATDQSDQLVQSVTKPRSRYSWMPFLLPLGLTGMSWMMGGMPPLTDAGFIALTLICLLYVIREMAVFPQRFGIGGLVLFGGTLIWFCYDYLIHWLGINFSGL